MPGARQTSCIACLCAIDPQGMVEIPLPHHAFLKDAAFALCQECCAAVLETCVRRHEEAPPSDQGALDHQGDQVPDSRPEGDAD
jgi:hypothetical protein